MHIVIYYPIEDTIDNVLTKALPKPKHMKCLTLMRIIELLDKSRHGLKRGVW